jgi:hypothetical protein
VSQKPFYTYIIDSDLIALAQYPEKMYESAFDTACRKATKIVEKNRQYMPSDVKLGWMFEKKENIVNFYYLVQK